MSASASCTWWAVWAILRATCVLDAWFPAAGRPAEPPCTPHLASATCGAPVGRQMPAGMHVQAPSREPGGVFASHRSFTTIPGAERGACITLLLWTPPPGAGGLGRRSIRLKRPAGLSEGHGQEEAGAELGRPGLAGPGRQPRRPAAPARDSVSDASCVGSGGRHPALHGLQPTPTSVQNLGAPSFCRPVEVLRQLQSGLSPGGALASEPLSLRCAVGGQAGVRAMRVVPAHPVLSPGDNTIWLLSMSAIMPNVWPCPQCHPPPVDCLLNPPALPPPAGWPSLACSSSTLWRCAGMHPKTSCAARMKRFATAPRSRRWMGPKARPERRWRRCRRSHGCWCHAKSSSEMLDSSRCAGAAAAAIAAGAVFAMRMCRLSRDQSSGSSRAANGPSCPCSCHVHGMPMPMPCLPVGRGLVCATRHLLDSSCR